MIRCNTSRGSNVSPGAAIIAPAHVVIEDDLLHRVERVLARGELLLSASARHRYRRNAASIRSNALRCSGVIFETSSGSPSGP
jgi:hypothetical protein